MNSAPHLLNEDRADYERVLAEALRTAHEDRDPATVTARLTSEQLRATALNATALITAAAAAEYDRYVKLRAESRSATAAGVLAPAVGAGEAGAGVAAVAAVLAPLLAGTAAAILLIVGYLLKMLSPPPPFADTLLSTGWVFGALTAAAILVAAVALLLTALRNDASHVADGGGPDRVPEEVALARDAWCEALLHRGMLPFLRAALAEQRPAKTAVDPPRSASRIPKVGYSGPDFSSPAEGRTTDRRPTFSSPDFSSPDFGGPEHRPD